VSYTGDDLSDNTTFLQAMTQGDIIEGGGVIWTVISNSDQGTYAEFIVAPSVTGISGVQTFRFETVVASPISIQYDAAYWSTSPYPNVLGLYGADVPYSGIATNDNAYMDIIFQEAYIPDETEWWLKIISGASGEAPASTRLTTQDTDWVRASSTLLTTVEVTTTDNQWTEAKRLTIPIGTGHRIRVRSTAKRTDGFGFYYGEVVGLMYNESGTVGVQDDTTFEQSTNPGMGMRIVADGGEAVFEVNGFAMQDWDWSAVGFHLEIE